MLHCLILFTSGELEAISTFVAAAHYTGLPPPPIEYGDYTRRLLLF